MIKESIKKYLNNFTIGNKIEFTNFNGTIHKIIYDYKSTRKTTCDILWIKEHIKNSSQDNQHNYYQKPMINTASQPNALKSPLNSTAQDTDLIKDVILVSLPQYNAPTYIKRHRHENNIKDEISGVSTRYVTIGFDSEWYIVNGNRKVLSFQFSIMLNNEINHVILYFSNGSDLKLRNVLKCLFNLLEIKDKKINLNLVAHFNNTDLSNFVDASELYVNCSSIRKSLVTLDKPIPISISDVNKHGQQINVHIRDTMLLSPTGSGLYDLGKIIGINKLDVNEYYISNMDKLMIDNPHYYTDYAINDAAIVLGYICMMFGDPNQKLFITLGGEACRLAKQHIMNVNNFKNEFEFNNIFLGYDIHKELRQSNGRFKTHKYYEDNYIASVLKNIALKSYYGGRNECFTNGVVYNRETFDIDLVGAYSTAMCLTPDIDYTIPPHVVHNSLLTLSLIKFDTIGFGYVKFKFPDNTMYPCLPVKDKDGRGLIYVKEGETYCTAPEVYVALLMGATIEAVDFYLPVTYYDKFSLRKVVNYFTELRELAISNYGEKSVIELTLKEMLNSIYGKLAQGLRHKRVYNLNSGETEEIGISPITSAVLASYITGLVRALISGAITELHTNGQDVHSVTTDGFITTASLEIMNKIKVGGMVDYFLKGRKIASGNDNTESIWAIKHYQKYLINMKTRGNIGLSPSINQVDNKENNLINQSLNKLNEVQDINLEYNKNGVLARNGYKMEKKDKNNGLALAEKYLSRTGKISNEVLVLDSPKSVRNGVTTGFGKIIVKMLDFEPDGKRYLDQAKDFYININGNRYAACYITTLPHLNMERFITYKGILQNNQLPIKSRDDVIRLNLVNSIKNTSDNNIKLNDTAYLRSMLIHYHLNNISFEFMDKFNAKKLYEYLIQKNVTEISSEQFIMLCKNCGRKDRQKNYLTLEMLSDFFDTVGGIIVNK